jgi:hypothetical protein
MAQRRAFGVPFEAAPRRRLVGVKLVSVPRHTDPRGSLIALDRDQSLPFDVQRVYWICQSSAGAVRGEHATSAHCALVALEGVVEVRVDNGQDRDDIRLSGTDQVLCLHAGVWLRLSNFSHGALVLVASSQRYAESSYYDRPIPELLCGAEHDRWR